MWKNIVKILISYIRNAIWGVPLVPFRPKVRIYKETPMGLVFNAFLPEVVDGDVVKKTVKVVVDGDVKLIEVAKDVFTVELPPVKDNAEVSVSVSHTDDAGNVSDFGQELVFIAVDTIVPATPGLVSVKLLAEVADPVVEPETEVVVEPEVTPDPVVEPEVTEPAE